jgi:hypothetical protein
MPLRILQLLGALLVVAALGVVPSVATSDNASPTARAADDDCDNNGPWSRWGSDWWHHDGGNRYWDGAGDGNGYFDGNSYYGNCARYGKVAGDAGAGRVVRVEVAAKRLHGDGRCQHLSRAGRLSKAGSCHPTRWMKADGVRNWRFDVANALPPGRYRLHRRAVDADGNREDADRLHVKIR